MATPEEEAQEKRKKRTIVLLTCGAVTLVLPLLGLLYIRMNEAKSVGPASSAVLFDRREDGEMKVNLVAPPAALAGPGESSLPVAGGPTMTTAPGGSSLDFIKGGANDRAAPEAGGAPAVAAAAAAPEPAAQEEPAAKAPRPKKEKKAFNSPKLQGTKSFSNFKGTKPGAAAADDPMQGMPPAAENPDVQKYLKGQAN